MNPTINCFNDPLLFNGRQLNLEFGITGDYTPRKWGKRKLQGIPSTTRTGNYNLLNLSECVKACTKCKITITFLKRHLV